MGQVVNNASWLQPFGNKDPLDLDGGQILLGKGYQSNFERGLVQAYSSSSAATETAAAAAGARLAFSAARTFSSISWKIAGFSSR